MNAVLAEYNRKRVQKGIPNKPFNKLTPTQKKEVVRLGADEFAKVYTSTFKKLANE